MANLNSYGIHSRGVPAVNEAQNPRAEAASFSNVGGSLQSVGTSECPLTSSSFLASEELTCRSRSVGFTGVTGDGRNLLAPSELRHSRRQSRILAQGTDDTRARVETNTELKVQRARRRGLEFLGGTKLEVPSNVGVTTNNGQIRKVCVGVTNIQIGRDRCVRPRWLTQLRAMQDEIDRAFVAESANDEHRSREYWEVRDARRVAQGQCGFYKFAKMLGEGKLSQYAQDGYWNSIARQSKCHIMDFLRSSTAAAMYNLTEHMRRSVAISLDHRKNMFDVSCRAEIIEFIRFLRGCPSLRSQMTRMEAQMGFFSILHKHEVTLDPTILEWIKNTEFDGLTKFIVSSITLVGATCSATSWSGRLWAFAQYLSSFDTTRSVLMLVVRRAPQYSQAFFRPMEAQSSRSRDDDAQQAMRFLDDEGETIWVALANVVASSFKMEIPKETWRNATRAKRFANIATVISSIDKIVETLHKVVELAKEGIQAYVHGMTISQWRLSGIAACMPNFAARVAYAYEQGGPIKARQNKDCAQQAMEFFREGSRYMEYVSGGGASHGQFAAFQAVWKMVLEMYQAAQDYYLTHTEREPPYVIHFIGPTGIGKSRLSQHIIADVATKVGLDYNKAFDHYFRNAQSPYWEGYTYQKVVFYDDFLQNPTTRAKECEEIIRIVNNAPYLLNMAQADLKGKTLFTSSFVLLSSNIDVPHDVSVADVDAVRRRRDIVVKVRVKDDYADAFGAVDLKRLRDGGRTFQDDIYTFTIVDSRTGEVRQQITDYVRLVDLIEAGVRMKLPDIARRASLSYEVPSSPDTLGVATISRDKIREWLTKIVVVPSWLKPNYFGKPKSPIELLSEELQDVEAFGDASSSPSTPRSVVVDEDSMPQCQVFSMDPFKQAGVIAVHSAQIHAAQAANRFNQMLHRVAALEQAVFSNKGAVYPAEHESQNLFLETTARMWYIEHYGGEVDVESLRQLLRIRSFEDYRRSFEGSLDSWVSWLRHLSRATNMRDLFPKDEQLPESKKFRLTQVEWALGIVLLALGTLGAMKIFRTWSQRTSGSGTEEELVPESGAFASGDERTRASKKKYEIKSLSELQEAQASRDPRALDLIKTKFSSAMCLVRLVKDDGEVGVHGTLIGGKLVAAPYHLIATTPYACEVEIVTITSTFRCRADEIVVRTDWKNVDLAVIIMPSHFPSYPKLVHHFVEQADICKYHLNDVAMLLLTPNGDYAMPYFQVLRNVARTGEHSYVARGDKIEEIHIIDSLSYQAETKFGDCGAPLVWFHPSVSRKILGFHVAGSQNIGSSNILTKELMTHVFLKVNTTQIERPELIDEVPTLRDGVAELAQMAYMGLMPQEKQFRQPSTSEIIPSRIYGEFPVITRPAALRTEGGKSPLELGVRKGCQVNCILPRDDLETVFDQVFDHYVDCMDRVRPRVLTVEEGLNGVEGDPWIRPLNMSTSPGFPYITECRQKPGKLDYVKFDGVKWQPLDRLRHAISHRILLAGERKIPETVFVDVLKDERRENEKVDALKTRIFNTCPMDLNIAIRMYFGHLATLIMDNHVAKEIAVGINYHSESWRALWQRLKANGPLWIAGDYSNYDKTFPRQLMMLVAHFANRFYNDGNNVIRETLMESLSNRIHLANRVVYFQTHGNPSGNVLTTIINSIGNMALMRLAWLILARQYEPRLELQFADHVALSVYGDDNVATVSRAARWFNMNNIARVLKPFGVVYTPPKVGVHESSDFIPVEEVTYLKRRFHLYKGLVLAPLPKDRIRETCNWIRRCADEVQATIDNIYMAQLEMFHWGQEEYELFQQEIREICKRYGFVPKTVPWTRYLIKFQEGTLSDDPILALGKDLAGVAPSSGSALSDAEASLQPRPGVASNHQMVAQSQNKNADRSETHPGVPQQQYISNIRVGGNTAIKVGALAKTRQENKISVGNQNANSPTHVPQVAEAKTSKVGKTNSKPKSAPSGTKVKARSVRDNMSNQASALVQALAKAQQPVIQINATKPKQLEKSVEVGSFTMKGEELLNRLDNTVRYIAVPLLPGYTNCPKLDIMTRNYSWCKWNKSPTLRYKPLSDVTTDSIWYYKVIHDTSLEQLANKSFWNLNDRSFTSQKATAPFAVSVPLSAMIKTKFSLNQVSSCSWVLLMHSGSRVDRGELFLRYDVTFGGTGADPVMPLTFKVEKGIFKDPQTGEDLEGIPTLGYRTSYQFSEPIKPKMVQDLVQISGSMPTTIVRNNDSKLVVTPDSEVQRVVMENKNTKPSWKTEMKELGKEIAAYGLAKTRKWFTGKKDKLNKVPRPKHPSESVIALIDARRTMQTRAISEDEEDGEYDLIKESYMDSPFGDFTGTVVVSEGFGAQLSYLGIPSVPPLVELPPESGENGEMQPRFGLPSGLVGNVLKGFSKALSVVDLVGTVAEKIGDKPVVTHKAADALDFILRDYDWAIRNPEEDNQDGETTPPEIPNDDYEDEGLENPLPELPDFGEDVEAPSSEVKWSASQRFFNLVATRADDDNIVVEWATATKYPTQTDYFLCPTPYNTLNEKINSWDQEKKLGLSWHMEVSDALRGHYLLLESYCYTDNGNLRFWNEIKGGLYLGSVCRYSAITETRSVVRVDDPTQFNGSLYQLVGACSSDTHWYEETTNTKGGRNSVIAVVKLGAVGDGDIARNFLSMWAHDRSNEIYNYPLINGAFKEGKPFGTLVDAPASRAVVPRQALRPELDPACPGFEENYEAYKEGKQEQRAVDTLPFPIEAGPVRLFIGGRMKAGCEGHDIVIGGFHNGYKQTPHEDKWWEHTEIVDFAYTKTDTATRWQFGFDDNGKPRTADYNKVACGWVNGTIDSNLMSPNSYGTLIGSPYFIKAPENISRGAYLCTETRFLCLNNGAMFTAYSRGNYYNSYNVASCSIIGPIAILRTVTRMADGGVGGMRYFPYIPMPLRKPYGDSQKYDQDSRGIAISCVCYMLKNKEAALKWSKFNYVGDEYTPVVIKTSGDNYYISNRVMELSSNRQFVIGDKVWPGSTDFSSLAIKATYSPFGLYCSLKMNEKFYTREKGILSALFRLPRMLRGPVLSEANMLHDGDDESTAASASYEEENHHKSLLCCGGRILS